jgi:hypothetical protein
MKPAIKENETENNTGFDPKTNRFDLDKLKLSQDFAAQISVKNVLLTVPVRKPNKQEFVQVHPSEDFQLQTAVIELKEKGETYLVDRSLWSELATEIIPKIIFTAISRQKVVFLWAINLPDDGKNQNEWHRSAIEAARLAMKDWVRVTANRSLGAYDCKQANGDLSAPDWSDVDFQKIVESAFKDKYIDSLDHQVVKDLRGER